MFWCLCLVEQHKRVASQILLFFLLLYSFFPPLNTEGGKTNNKGSKKNPAFALTLKTIKQQ